MGNIITLYHGSQVLVKVPKFGEGRLNNDYGLGFYCTESIDIAKEWAVNSLNDGFANQYSLDTTHLNILNLNGEDFTIMNWIATLIEHRIFSIKTPTIRRAKSYLIDNFAVNVNAYDLIKGYRADDSYFDYAQLFLNNSISIGQLSKAMKLGDLGEQIVIKSQFAFSKLKFEGFEFADKNKYYALRKIRDEKAKENFNSILEEDDDSLFIQQIMKEGIKNNDLRIPRNICK